MRPPGPASTTNARFTARDQAILRFIAKARWCHARALMTPFDMSYDMVHRRLRAMVALGLIRSSQQENRTHKAEPAFYSIRERGVAELQRLYNDDVVRVSGLPRQKDHHRAVVELHGAFLGAMRSKRVGLDAVLYDHDLRRPGVRRVVIPDLVVRLRRATGERLDLYVEVDLGTVSPSRMTRRVEAYAGAWGGRADRRLLIATRCKRRLRILAKANLEAERAPPLYYAVLSELTSRNVLTAEPWCREVVDESTARFPASSPIEVFDV